MALRRGMLIKNVSERPVHIEMEHRSLDLSPGEEQFVSAHEVRDSGLREHLQIRSVAVVRPATEQEDRELIKGLEDPSQQADSGNNEEE